MFLSGAADCVCVHAKPDLHGPRHAQGSQGGEEEE